MDNPHAERQAVLLERILKNSVCPQLPRRHKYSILTFMVQAKCTEMILELNHCVEVNNATEAKEISIDMFNYVLQEILRANASVKTASDLAMKYRKNVQYNLEANKPREGTED